MSETPATTSTATPEEAIALLARNPLAGIETKSPTEGGPAAPSEKPTLLARLKSYAWRASATYIWLSFGALLVGRYDELRRGSARASAFLIDALSKVGFSPTDPSYFALIVKFSWLLLITGFSVIEIAGFVLYVLGFPLGVLLWLVFGRVFKKSFTRTDPAKRTAKPGPSRNRKRLPLLTIASLGLLAWFLLYADSSALHVLAVGALFAGLLFAVLFVRFFRRVRPIGEEEAALLGRLEVWAFGCLELGGKATLSAKTEIPMYRWMFGWVHRVYRRLALLVRGRRGRDRMSIYVLLEYATSAILLAVAAVIFWSLVIKCALSPHFLPTSQAIQLAASHFIPGVSVSADVPHPPFWLNVAAGATAWLLFVIVLAPAGSVLPMRQAAHASRLAQTYKRFRLTTRACRRFLVWLDRVESAR